ncbi:MAG: response regulator [Deltaproteobacteria bacterium]|nr:response regulator [Deltaproteobacteria bacterium]
MPGETVLVIDDSPTILKVVQLVLTKAGFQVHVAPDGEAGLAAAHDAKPDMILLDFVMPKMNGYQVCRALAGDEALKDVPVVLMSAKGDQVGERFVKVMGIVDYITKPFSPEAITAVVQHTIAKYVRRSGQDGLAVIEGGEPGRPLIQGNEPPPEEEEGDRGGSATTREGARTQAIAEVREVLVGKLSQKLDPTQVAEAAQVLLDDAFMGELLTKAVPVFEQPKTGEPALQGDLKIIPIAEVLQLLHAQSQAGILQVQRASAAVDVFFRQGKIDLAAARGVSEEFLLGRFILESQVMTKQDLDAFLKSRTPGSKLLGDQLVKLGYLSEGELRRAIVRQTCELIYEILRWNHGRFAFTSTRDLPPVAVQAALGLDIEEILMEGFRRVDEWHLIEREIENFDLVFLRNEDAVTQMGRGRLTREELAVLELVNGKNSVKEIVRQSRMGSFDVSKMLYRLLSIKLIRRRVMPVAV